MPLIEPHPDVAPGMDWNDEGQTWYTTASFHHFGTEYDDFIADMIGSGRGDNGH